jgi:hypothetical protein
MSPIFRLTDLTRFSILFTGILFGSCSHKLAPEGHFQSTAVVADGRADDWSLPLRFSDANYTLQYTVTNDDKNVYVCIASREESAQMRMLQAGMNIYFDPKGEKNKEIAITYPLRKQPDPERNIRGRNGDPIPGGGESIDSRKEKLLLESDYYSTTGFQDIENGQFAVADIKSPIRMAMKLNNNDSLLVYEVVIPIKNIIGTGLTPKSLKKNFSVGIVLNSVPGQAVHNNNVARRQPNFGIRGMGGMGMRGGRGGGGGSSAHTPDVKEEDNWYQFRLVTK